MKFLRFWSRKKTFNFCGLKILAKKNCLYYRKQQQKGCYDKQLVHITVILKSKNIFSSLESFQRLQLLNTHLVNLKFVLRNYFFTVFEIYFVDRKYEVNSWVDIGINFDIFRIYIFNVEFSYLIIITIFLKRIMIRSNCIQFLMYNVDIKTQVNRNSTTCTFLFLWFLDES